LPSGKISQVNTSNKANGYQVYNDLLKLGGSNSSPKTRTNAIKISFLFFLENFKFFQKKKRKKPRNWIEFDASIDIGFFG